MKHALIPITVLTLCGMMAAQAGTVPPPPPQPYSSTPQAATPAPATPAPPATTPSPAPRAARPPRVQVYRATTVSTGGSYLGVDVRDVTPDRVGPLKLKNDEGVEITMVDQDAPAGKAGLKEHDVVVSFNGQSVQSSEQLRRLIREAKAGQSVPVGIMRDGQQQTVPVTLADSRKLAGTTHRMIIPQMAMPPGWTVRVPDIEIPSFVMTTGSRRNGITVEGLTNQLGDYFGVKNGEGVLVRSVEKGSKAETAGLKAGDVIVRVDNERVSDTRDWTRLLHNHDAGTVKLGIMRERREQTLSMTLPEQKSDESNLWFSSPDMENLRMQLQNLGPSMKDQAEIQARIAREMAAHQKEIQSAMRDAQREIEQSMRDYQRDHERTMREMQSDRERTLRDMQREKERQQREKEKAKEKQTDDQEQ